MSYISKEDFTEMILDIIENEKYKKFLKSMANGGEPLFEEGFVQGLCFASILTCKLESYPDVNGKSKAESLLLDYIKKSEDSGYGSYIRISSEFWDEYGYNDTLKAINHLEVNGYKVEYRGFQDSKVSNLSGADSIIISKDSKD